MILLLQAFDIKKGGGNLEKSVTGNHTLSKRSGKSVFLKRLRENWQLYLIISPVVVYFFVFNYMPLYGVQLAFRRFNPTLGILGSPWIGFDNFTRFFNSIFFVRIVTNTLMLNIYGLIAGFPIPIIIALMFNEIRNAKLKKSVQTIVIAPHFIAMVVMVGMPTTIDELFNTFVAFRDNDPNRSGLNDAIPLSGARAASPMAHLGRFYGSFGFGGNHGIIANYLDVDDHGQIRLIVSDPYFRPMIEFLHRLWAENLIDREFFSQENSSVIAKIADNRVGFTMQGNNNVWKGANRNDFVQNPPPVGPNGHSFWTAVSAHVTGTGTFVITPVNQHPEATMRWVDHLYSEEGTAMVRFGLEGYTFIFNDEGRRELLPHIQNCPDGLTLDQAIGRWTFFPGGGVPQNIHDAVDASAAQLPEIRAATEVLRPHLIPFTAIPHLKFTEDEARDLAIFGHDIFTYLDENITMFITGERPLSDFDAFLSQLSRLNIDGLLEIYQNSFDRWLRLG